MLWNEDDIENAELVNLDGSNEYSTTILAEVAFIAASGSDNLDFSMSYYRTNNLAIDSSIQSIIEALAGVRELPGVDALEMRDQLALNIFRGDTLACIVRFGLLLNATEFSAADNLIQGSRETYAFSQSINTGNATQDSGIYFLSYLAENVRDTRAATLGINDRDYPLLTGMVNSNGTPAFLTADLSDIYENSIPENIEYTEEEFNDVLQWYIDAQTIESPSLMERYSGSEVAWIILQDILPADFFEANPEDTINAFNNILFVDPDELQLTQDSLKYFGLENRIIINPNSDTFIEDLIEVYMLELDIQISSESSINIYPENFISVDVNRIRDWGTIVYGDSTEVFAYDVSNVSTFSRMLTRDAILYKLHARVNSNYLSVLTGFEFYGDQYDVLVRYLAGEETMINEFLTEYSSDEILSEIILSNAFSQSLFLQANTSIRRILNAICIGPNADPMDADTRTDNLTINIQMFSRIMDIPEMTDFIILPENFSHTDRDKIASIGIG
ncbi:MAG: hypothetical protein Q9M91_05855 [Candidatus Dojkabacteria bacterium]|nr:hypothetical protein [Candidatus Dojkabacteria bacterium]MDQ7021324.1 hypothetical protein [Candidatus Dojkabacteria bacterium]